MVFPQIKKQQKTVNFVFTDEAIRFIEVGQGAKCEVLKMDERRLDQGKIKDGRIIAFQSLRLELEELVGKLRIKKRQVRFTVPDQQIIVRQIDVPLDIKEDKLKSYLFLEIGSTIHLPFEEAVFDCVPLGKSGDKQKVLLIAAPEDVVHTYTQLLESVGLKPIAADIAPLSLYRLCHFSNIVGGNDHVMLLNFDENLLTISIFHHDILVFMRPVILKGEHQLSKVDLETNSYSQTLYMLEDAFKEIEKVMSFYMYTLNQGNAEVNLMIVSGDHSDLNVIQNHLFDRLQIRTISLISELFSYPPGCLIPTSYSTVLGLALKEVAT